MRVTEAALAIFSAFILFGIVLSVVNGVPLGRDRWQLALTPLGFIVAAMVTWRRQRRDRGK